jgi:protein disulfide-isomerase A6
MSELANKADIPPEIHEVVNQKTYTDNCKGTVICIIHFLPNIYDSNAKERQGYLDLITKTAKANRKHPFKWFWLSAGDQLDLERSLNLGFGFPAVIAISPQKKLISTMRMSFSYPNMKEYLGELLIGKGNLEALKTDITIKKADAWDGKDAPVIQDEYEDL